MPETTATKLIWWFEVCVRGSYCRQPGSYASFVEAQRAAIKNKKYPYRVKSTSVQVTTRS